MGGERLATIGTLNERSLHASLKSWYAQPEDRLESRVDGYVVDLVRGDLLVEIQTRSFAAIKRKLAALTEDHVVRLVYPIAGEKWIVNLAAAEGQVRRRRSPKRGKLAQVFGELVSFPDLLRHPNFSLEVLLIQEEEVRAPSAPRGRYRKTWVTAERRLVGVVERHLFETPADMAWLIPTDLADPFTTRELAQALGGPVRLGQQMAYCLSRMGTVAPLGKRGQSILYTRRWEF